MTVPTDVGEKDIKMMFPQKKTQTSGWFHGEDREPVGRSEGRFFFFKLWKNTHEILHLNHFKCIIQRHLVQSQC